MKKADSEHLIEYASLPHIELIGCNECIIDGLKGIIKYDSEKIKVDLGKFSVTFYGDGLYINSFSHEGAIVSGTVVSVEFEGNA